ncbi:MAG: TolC family protein [Betaproteobacteria bacterium]|nr:TolC family protein [Betaproteobacteria bacterium]
MKKLLLHGCLGAGLAWASLAMAQGMAAPADLPPSEAVERAISSSPQVRAAHAGMRSARAEHGALKAGEHEYGLSLTTQRRNVSGGPDHTEWGLAVERGLRLPGKARLDEQIGAQGVLAAVERIGDARHETARQLLGLWYAVRQARLEAVLWRKQADLYREQQRVVSTRVKRGDAARIDLLQADAALAQAGSQATAAAAREQAALAELKARFPELPPPDDSAAQPMVPEGDEAAWLAQTLEHNHELLMAQRTLEQARLQTRRAEANRMPDPTLGLHFANEQGGNEKIVGVSISIPLPGEARHSQSWLRLAQAEALAEMEAATRRRLAAEAAANWQRAAAGVESWQRLEEAAQALARHADLARRAMELGEIGLSETMLAQRTALEAQLAAGQARLAANEATARLMLDAHRLWPLGYGDELH